MPLHRIPCVLLLATLCACGSTDPSSGPKPDVVITVGAATKGATAFSPDTLTISLASHPTVRWGNADYTGGTYSGGTTVAHTVTADSGAFDSGQIQARSGFNFTFTAAGTYGYHCSNHPTMVGAIVVTP